MARKWWCAKYEREVVMLRLGGGFVWERRCRLPVSRILSILLARDWTAISLTPPRRSALLAQGATNTRGWNGRATLPLFCLAPRGVCIATRVTPRCGGLLPHHFTLTLFGSGSCGGRFVFCCTFRPGSSRFPSPVFTGRAALWCPDFPRTEPSEEDRPATARGTAPPLSAGLPANATGKFQQFPARRAQPRATIRGKHLSPQNHDDSQ